MAEAAIATKTTREIILDSALGRCKHAWVEGDFHEAQCLNGLCDSLEGMSDEEFELRSNCDNPDCDCDF